VSRFSTILWLTLSLYFARTACCQTEYQQQIDPNSAITLSPTSPLATDGQMIYAIDRSRHVVVMAEAEAPYVWVPLVRVDKGTIISITASPSLVYILDEYGNIFWVRSGTLSRSLLPREALTHILVNQESELRQIVYSAGSLFLLGENTLYRLNVETSQLISKSSLPSNLPLTLAGQGNDIIAAEPSTGNVYEINFENRGTLLDSITWLVLGEAKKNRPKANMPDDVVLGSDPSSSGVNFRSNVLAVYAREIYAIDELSKGLFVFSLHNRRPSRIEYRNKTFNNPESMLVTRDSIYVLDSSSERLLRLPRLIPGEVKFDSSDPAGPSVAIFEYLKKQEILPTRAVVISGNVDETLARAGIALSVTQPEFNSFLCSLNYSSCKDGEARSIVSGSPLLIPDVYSEHIIDIKDVDLTGQPLGDEISKAVVKPEFESWKNAGRVASLNDLPPTNDVLNARTGRYKIYVEKTRLVSAFYPEDLLNPQSPLHALKRDFRNKLSINSLTETSSAAASMPHCSIEVARKLCLEMMASVEDSVLTQVADPASQQQTMAPPPIPPDLSDNEKQTLSKEYKDLMGIIHYSRPGRPDAFAQATPKVGVVEDNVDTADPDFDAATFESWDQLVPVQNSASVPSNTFLHRIRDFDETLDHGTSVAALIGAQTVDIDGNGLAAPQVVMIPISSKDPPIGEEIRQAELLGTTIFNLSLSFKVGETPQGLQDAVDLYRDSLFVVAAGHHTDEACKPPLTYYPLCWGDKPNVLTVAATVADGSSLMTKITAANGREIHGSDWSQQYVWIAAPGEGYHSSGRGGSYVPVRGTSFATPLVTATAALLYAEGIKSGPDIKTRIVYTADYKSNLKDKVVTGGFLNVERALKFPRRTILVNEDKSELIVDLVLGTDLVIPTATDNIKIALRNVKRVTRDGNKYRLIYVEHNVATRSDVIRFIENASELTTAPWKFSYYELNPGTFAHGKKVQADLGNFRDFIGPAE
jgi:hypothetical protein